jgi:replicative DNA helicase
VQLIDSALAPQFDRLPPNALPSEMCMLASMMLDQAGDMTGDILQEVSEGDLFQADHQIIFRVIRQFYEANRPVDGVILGEELKTRQLLDEIGGYPYLAEILSSVPNAAHGMQYARAVRDKAMLRRVITVNSDSLRRAYAPHEDARTVLELFERDAFAIAETATARKAVSFETVMQETIESIENRDGRGLETGYFDIDDALNGMQPGEMIILAARPSMGKTALAMNIVEHAAVDLMKPVGVFSLEMGKHQLAQRMLCGRAGVDSHTVRRGMCGQNEFAKLTSACAELAAAPIYVDDSSTLTPLELRARARRLKRQHGIELLVIDYLQLMDADRENRTQEVSEISRAVKAVARELNIPVIALSQLNRQTESRGDRRPRMSDLRESGSLEQDADVVMLLHREDYYHLSDEGFVPDNIAEVIIAKQRNGPTGMHKLAFNPKVTRFVNLSMLPPEWV